jgi:hypothetical protein
MIIISANTALSLWHAFLGLGLALTRRIGEAQGGRVGVESTPGRGRRFFAILPRVTFQESIAEPAAAPPPHPDAPCIRGRMPSP